MPSLNKGKYSVGDGHSYSYGNQSPADDAIPLDWIAGDVRYYEGSNVGASKLISKWICLTSGKPGTWQQIDFVPNWPILQVPFVYNGTYVDLIGEEAFMAPATADWGPVISELGTAPNVFQLPATQNFNSVGISGPAPTLVILGVFFNRNQWDTPTPNALTFRVRKSDGTLLGSGTVDAILPGSFTPVSVSLPPGTLDGQQAVMASLETDLAIGTGNLQFTAVLSVYRDATADFIS